MPAKQRQEKFTAGIIYAKVVIKKYLESLIHYLLLVYQLHLVLPASIIIEPASSCSLLALSSWYPFPLLHTSIR
jgi:hypothetical protein